MYRFVPLSLVLLTALPAQDEEPGKLEISALFSDHMVIQRGAAVPVWGWSDPIADVSATIAGGKTKTKADVNGRWMLELAPLPAGGPHELVIAGAGRRLRIKDVLVGEVWLGSGQSNMAMQVRSSKDFEKEKAAANFPKIRMFTVARASQTTAQERCKGTWKVCSPETVGGFSATAYFFGRKLHAQLNDPVGLINSSWGGTAIEAWTSMAVQEGRADLAAVFATWENQRAKWSPEKAEAKHAVQLANWQKRVDAARKAKKREPRRPRKPRDPALNQNHPANLFNGMIAPLIPYAIRGVIWYQGERNARTIDTATRYRVQMPMMIQDWRQRWGRGDFPFGIVQLPNFKARSDKPGVSTAWAVIRESMLQTLGLKNTGVAITIDVGEARDIHPKNKQAVGDRLACWALAEVYGHDIVASGPLVRSSSVDRANVVLSYRHAKGGLRTRDNKPVRGFAIAGTDRKWHWATAKIDGDRVVISHPDVESPVAIRYAWGDNPDCNLVNQAGLPASPFRTDDWPK